MEQWIRIEVPGIVRTKGSHKAVPVGRKGDPDRRWAVRDAQKETKPWQDMIAWSASQQYRGPKLAGAIQVVCVFCEVRPKTHYGTGRNERILKDSAPAFPMAKNKDLDKMLRAACDGITASQAVWEDDKLVVGAGPFKVYTDRFDEPFSGARIFIRPHRFQTVRDLLIAGQIKPAPFQDFGEFEQLALVS